MKIRHNLPALSAFGSLNRTNNALGKTLLSLSSGLRINSPSDDVAGFAVSQKLRSQFTGVDMALRNTQDAVSLIQTADGALNDTNSMLSRIRDLSIQAANDTLTLQDRQALQMEIDELRNNIDCIAHNTAFNGKHLLDGSLAVSCKSSDSNVKASVKGNSQTQGVYRVNVTFTPPKPAIWTSKTLRIKDDGVITGKHINNNSGISDITGNNIPAGKYSLSSSNVSTARIIPNGVYGLSFSDLEAALSPSVRNSCVDANASILFEVTDTSDDTITLKASSNLLSVDGKNDTVYADDITLTQGENVDLSTSLGVGDEGALTFRLDDAGAFSIGDKFVYNLSAAKNAQTSININSLNDMNTSAVMATNPLRPNDPLPSAAKVVFVIDNSGSMGSSFTTVKSHISSFIDSIKAQGADDVQVGIARYLTNGLQNTSYDWYSDEQEIIDALSINLVGGSVDPYKAITDTVSNYDMSDVVARHIILITDTGQEVPTGATLESAQTALREAGITLSAVSNGSVAIRSLITSKGMDLSISDSEWGDKLVEDLGAKIGSEAIVTAINDTPLSEYREFEGLFSGEGGYTLTVNSSKGIQKIEVLPDDTLSSLAEKLSAGDGVSGAVKYEDEADSGEKVLTIKLDLEGVSGVKVSGDAEFLEALGLKSSNDAGYGVIMPADGEVLNIREYYLDGESGRVMEGEIVITSDGSGAEYGEIGEFEVLGAGAGVKSDVKLRDIEDFSEILGRNECGELEIGVIGSYGEAESVKVAFRADDTLKDFADKLDVALMKYGVSARVENVKSENGEEVSVIEVESRGVIELCGLTEFLGLERADTSEAGNLGSVVVNAVDELSGREVLSTEATELTNEWFALIPPDIELRIDAIASSAHWDEATQKFMLVRQRTYSAMLQIENSSAAFQTGANMGEIYSVRIGDMSANALGISGVNVLTREAASKSVSILDRAISRVSEQRALLGTYTSGLEGVSGVLTTESVNLKDAESRIRDADMAAVMLDYIRLQVLGQTGNAVLSQANQLPQSVMALMK